MVNEDRSPVEIGLRGYSSDSNVDLHAIYEQSDYRLLPVQAVSQKQRFRTSSPFNSTERL